MGGRAVVAKTTTKMLFEVVSTKKYLPLKAEKAQTSLEGLRDVSL